MLPPFVPLPYKTAAELLAAAESGVQFLFVRSDTGTAKPAKLKLCISRPGNVRALDLFSRVGDSFSPNGRGANKKFYLVSASVSVAGTKPEAKPSPLDQIMPSDKVAVAAYRAQPKAAPVRVIPPVAVKPNDGLLAMANPDDRRFVWGVKL